MKRMASKGNEQKLSTARTIILIILLDHGANALKELWDLYFQKEMNTLHMYVTVSTATELKLIHGEDGNFNIRL